MNEQDQEIIREQVEQDNDFRGLTLYQIHTIWPNKPMHILSFWDVRNEWIKYQNSTNPNIELDSGVTITPEQAWALMEPDKRTQALTEFSSVIIDNVSKPADPDGKIVLIEGYNW